MKTTNTFRKHGAIAGFFCLAGLLTMMAACDSLESDSSLDAPQATVTDKQIYVQSKSSTLINLNSLVNSNKPVTLAVTSSTKQGTLTDLGGGILQYSPSSRSANARDGFQFTISANNEVIKSDSISIIITNDSTSLPCGIYPTEDIVYGYSKDSSLVMDVLSNDYICGYDTSELKLSIYAADSFPPYFGSARVKGNKIVYTPNNASSGSDKIVYKLAAKNDSSVYALGFVYITGQYRCSFTVQSDSVVSLKDFTQIRIKGLQNDSLCAAVNNYQVTISTPPTHGSVYVDAGDFVYTPTNLATNGFTDNFGYKVCIDGTCKTAHVTIRVND